jgi:hypothetical protein
MRRVALLGVALAAAASPLFVHAGAAQASMSPSDPRSDGSAIGVANAVIQYLPTPPGWDIRHLCYVDDDVNKSVCLFFPFPM